MPWPSTYIDPTIPIDPEARRSVRCAAWRKWNRNPINGLAFGLGLGVPILLFPWISHQLTPIQSWTGFPAFLATFSIYVLYLFTLAACLRRWRFAPLVYAELCDRGFDICLKCGYWLRDLDDGIINCPECGLKRDAIPPIGKR